MHIDLLAIPQGRAATLMQVAPSQSLLPAGAQLWPWGGVSWPRACTSEACLGSQEGDSQVTLGDMEPLPTGSK